MKFIFRFDNSGWIPWFSYCCFNWVLKLMKRKKGLQMWYFRSIIRNFRFNNWIKNQFYINLVKLYKIHLHFCILLLQITVNVYVKLVRNMLFLLINRLFNPWHKWWNSGKYSWVLSWSRHAGKRCYSCLDPITIWIHTS